MKFSFSAVVFLPVILSWIVANASFHKPTAKPTVQSSIQPSLMHNNRTSMVPSMIPSTIPSMIPSIIPSTIPSMIPSSSAYYCDGNTLSLTVYWEFPDFSQCTAIISLYIYYTWNLKSIPAEISQLRNLQTLYIYNTGLTSLPPEIGQLTNLRTLSLYYNYYLTVLPVEIGLLINLQTLIIHYNSQLSAIPAEIGFLDNLQTLSITYGYQLTALPAEIGQLGNLQALSINNNYQLTALPAEIGQLGNLQTLSITYNYQLTALPTEIGQLGNLQNLDLSNNNIFALPAEIGQLIELQTLVIAGNQLTTLPAEIGQLVNLWYFFLSAASIPREIGLLVDLKVLRLSGTFTELPAEIGQLRGLKILDLGNAQLLTSLPVELGQLTTLQRLTGLPYMGANGNFCLPKSLLSLSALWQNINIYYYADWTSPLRMCVDEAPIVRTPMTVTGYVVHRSRDATACNGQVRNVTGTAVGCGGFVRSTCVETGDMVLVIRRFLDSRDPRSLHCESGASEVRVEISEYPRCDENTGLATSCATLDVTEVPYPRKHAGMVTLGFRDESQCTRHLSNPAEAMPVSFEQSRNAACLWDPRYEFWYREVCDRDAGTVAITLYADSACKKKAKRSSVHGLSTQIPGLNQCVPYYDTSNAFWGYRTKYCHN